MTRIEKIVTDDPKAFVELFYKHIGVSLDDEIFPCDEDSNCMKCRYVDEPGFECNDKVKEWLMQEP